MFFTHTSPHFVALVYGPSNPLGGEANGVCAICTHSLSLYCYTHFATPSSPTLFLLFLYCHFLPYLPIFFFLLLIYFLKAVPTVVELIGTSIAPHAGGLLYLPGDPVLVCLPLPALQFRSQDRIQDVTSL